MNATNEDKRWIANHQTKMGTSRHSR